MRGQRQGILNMATAAAALIARARREIQHHFFAEDAVRPERAIPFTPTNRIERRQFEKLIARGAVREEGGGRYWIDVVAYDIDLQRRHRIVRNILLIVAVAMIVTTMLTAHSAR